MKILKSSLCLIFVLAVLCGCGTKAKKETASDPKTLEEAAKSRSQSSVITLKGADSINAETLFSNAVYFSGGKLYYYSFTSAVDGENNAKALCDVTLGGGEKAVAVDNYYGTDCSVMVTGGNWYFIQQSDETDGQYDIMRTPYKNVIQDILGSDFTSLAADLALINGELYRAYYDMSGNTEKYKVDISALGNENISALYHGLDSYGDTAIIKTDKAFYLISEKASADAANTAESERINRITKIDTLTEFYDDVLNIAPGYVITKDKKAILLKGLLDDKNY